MAKQRVEEEKSKIKQRRGTVRVSVEQLEDIPPPVSK